jgi:hypothetical protein
LPQQIGLRAGNCRFAFQSEHRCQLHLHAFDKPFSRVPLALGTAGLIASNALSSGERRSNEQYQTVLFSSGASG